MCLDFSNCHTHVHFLFQFPIAFLVFGFEAFKLHKDHRMRMGTGSLEYICEASIEWSATSLASCAMSGIVGWVVGGLLGSGGGFILGPLLLEIGVIPQVHYMFPFQLCLTMLLSGSQKITVCANSIKLHTKSETLAAIVLTGVFNCGSRKIVICSNSITL